MKDETKQTRLSQNILKVSSQERHSVQRNGGSDYTASAPCKPKR